MKQKALIFYTYLPPWRIDIFNAIGEIYDLTIVFLNDGAKGFTYNKDLLLKELNPRSIFWNKGFKIGSKAVRYGIYGLIKKHNPEVVFSHEYSPTSILLASFLTFRLCNYKLVITTSDNLSMAESTKGLKRIVRKYVLRASSRVIVYSNPVKKYYQSNFPGLNVEVCPNIQNPESLLKLTGSFDQIFGEFRLKFKITGSYILYTGRLEKVKGLDLLLTAYAETLKDSHQLIIVGDGSQKEKLEELAKSLHLTDRVIFPGYFDGERLHVWYHMADFFVLPSRYEPFGAVVNEALVYGCPVLASKNIGALEFIQNNVNGIIFNPEEKEEFKTALLEGREQFSGSGKNKKTNLMIRSFNDYINAFELTT